MNTFNFSGSDRRPIVHIGPWSSSESRQTINQPNNSINSNCTPIKVYYYNFLRTFQMNKDAFCVNVWSRMRPHEVTQHYVSSSTSKAKWTWSFKNFTLRNNCVMLPGNWSVSFECHSDFFSGITVRFDV